MLHRPYGQPVALLPRPVEEKVKDARYPPHHGVPWSWFNPPYLEAKGRPYNGFQVHS